MALHMQQIFSTAVSLSSAAKDKRLSNWSVLAGYSLFLEGGVVWKILDIINVDPSVTS